MAEPGPSLLVNDLGELAEAESGPAWEGVPAMLPALGLALRRARVRRGIRQEDVADQIGVSASLLSRLERGGRWPRLNTVLALCNVLGVRFSDVVRAAEDEAFPLGDTPWTESPSVLIGSESQPGDVSTAALCRGGDA